MQLLGVLFNYEFSEWVLELCLLIAICSVGVAELYAFVGRVEAGRRGAARLFLPKVDRYVTMTVQIYMNFNDVLSTLILPLHTFDHSRIDSAHLPIVEDRFAQPKTILTTAGT